MSSIKNSILSNQNLSSKSNGRNKNKENLSKSVAKSNKNLRNRNDNFLKTNITYKPKTGLSKDSKFKESQNIKTSTSFNQKNNSSKNNVQQNLNIINTPNNKRNNLTPRSRSQSQQQEKISENKTENSDSKNNNSDTKFNRPINSTNNLRTSTNNSNSNTNILTANKKKPAPVKIYAKKTKNNKNKRNKLKSASASRTFYKGSGNKKRNKKNRLLSSMNGFKPKKLYISAGNSVIKERDDEEDELYKIAPKKQNSNRIKMKFPKYIPPKRKEEKPKPKKPKTTKKYVNLLTYFCDQEKKGKTILDYGKPREKPRSLNSKKNKNTKNLAKEKPVLKIIKSDSEDGDNNNHNQNNQMLSTGKTNITVVDDNKKDKAKNEYETSFGNNNKKYKLNDLKIKNGKKYEKNTQKEITQPETYKLIPNDPLNPYSTSWASNFLKAGYDSCFEYNEFTSGVPKLKVRNLKKKTLPPIKQDKEKLGGSGEYPTIKRLEDPRSPLNQNINENKKSQRNLGNLDNLRYGDVFPLSDGENNENGIEVRRYSYLNGIKEEVDDN